MVPAGLTHSLPLRWASSRLSDGRRQLTASPTLSCAVLEPSSVRAVRSPVWEAKRWLAVSLKSSCGAEGWRPPQWCVAPRRVSRRGALGRPDSPTSSQQCQRLPAFCLLCRGVVCGAAPSPTTGTVGGTQKAAKPHGWPWLLSKAAERIKRMSAQLWATCAVRALPQPGFPGQKCERETPTRGHPEPHPADTWRGMVGARPEQGDLWGQKKGPKAHKRAGPKQSALTESLTPKPTQGRREGGCRDHEGPLGGWLRPGRFGSQSPPHRK